MSSPLCCYVSVQGWKQIKNKSSSYDNKVGVNANAGYIWKLKQVLWQRLICGKMLVSKESKEMTEVPLIQMANGDTPLGSKAQRPKSCYW